MSIRPDPLLVYKAPEAGPGVGGLNPQGWLSNDLLLESFQSLQLAA
jgi:hypothetical protein